MEEREVQFAATVGRVVAADKSGVGRILLEDVQIDGSPFRDHTWVQSNKRIDALHLQEGDMISGRAKLYAYVNLDDYDTNKLGLKKLRGVVKHEAWKGDTITDINIDTKEKE